MSDSSVTIIGNATRDVELRFTPSGQAIGTFAVAVNRKWTQNGQTKEQTSYFDVKAWGSLGENAAASVTKGCRVIVTGRLEQETWEKDGEKKSRVVLVADGIGPDLRFNTAEVCKVDRERKTFTGAAPADSPEDPF